MLGVGFRTLSSKEAGYQVPPPKIYRFFLIYAARPLPKIYEFFPIRAACRNRTDVKNMLFYAEGVGLILVVNSANLISNFKKYIYKKFPNSALPDFRELTFHSVTVHNFIP